MGKRILTASGRWVLCMLIGGGLSLIFIYAATH
jgi:hypothetical protein